MELAMDARILDHGNNFWHYNEFREMEKSILHASPNMTRIILVEKDGRDDEEDQEDPTM